MMGGDAFGLGLVVIILLLIAAGFFVSAGIGTAEELADQIVDWLTEEDHDGSH